jgi:hypothetical protein
MSYTARISRLNPSCILLLIDQSDSMSDLWGEDTLMRKADKVADITNRFLQALSVKCVREDGVRNYYHIGCIGYGSRVGPAFSGVLADRDIIPLSEIADNPARIDQRTKKVEDRTGGLVETSVRFPIWFDPIATGGTPMCQAFRLATELLGNFLVRSPSCFPPIVINITDGQASDGNPEPYAQNVRDLASEDGNVLLYNTHISGQGKPILFPNREDDLPDDFARVLFRMSSILPPAIQEMLLNERHHITQTTRGFIYNGNPLALMCSMEIGTRSVDLR